MSITAMKQALEALHKGKVACEWGQAHDHVQQIVQAMESLRQAIEQAEQAQPVAWVTAGPHTSPLRTHWEGCEAVHPECKAEQAQQYVMKNAQGELERISLVQTGVGIGKQAEQAQPVAVYRAGQAPGEVYHVQFFKEMNADEVLLYTAPLPRKPLTEDQIAECANSVKWSNAYHFAFARAIEAAHGIKEEA